MPEQEQEQPQPRLIEKSFTEFVVHCFPEEIFLDPQFESQYTDLRRTFFAGAAAMFTELVQRHSRRPNEEAVKTKIYALREELHLFTEELQKAASQ